MIEKFYGVFSTGDMSVLPEILAENYTQYPADPGQTPDIDCLLNMLSTSLHVFLSQSTIADKRK